MFISSGDLCSGCFCFLFYRIHFNREGDLRKHSASKRIAKRMCSGLTFVVHPESEVTSVLSTEDKDTQFYSVVICQAPIHPLPVEECWEALKSSCIVLLITYLNLWAIFYIWPSNWFIYFLCLNRQKNHRFLKSLVFYFPDMLKSLSQYLRHRRPSTAFTCWYWSAQKHIWLESYNLGISYFPQSIQVFILLQVKIIRTFYWKLVFYSLRWDQMPLSVFF